MKTDLAAITDKVFFDTNILVYAYDRRDPAKQERAFNIIADAISNENGIVSAQVLGEFYNATTRRTSNTLPEEVTSEAMSLFATLPVIDIDLALVQRAVGTCNRYRISYWDSLIIAAAEKAGCTQIFSEDFNTGQTYHGILIFNPFKS